jgi:hypothetical protein
MSLVRRLVPSVELIERNRFLVVRRRSCFLLIRLSVRQLVSYTGERERSRVRTTYIDLTGFRP